MNLYRLSPYRGSKATIGTWFEMVSCGSRFSERLTEAAAVRDSQSHQKQWIKMDVDGSHIRVLFLTFIWKFCPELLEKGYIYAAVPPLYKATYGTNIKYLVNDAALAEFRASMKKSFDLGRMKGLGEMDPEEMAETVMNPNTRILKQITMEDAAAVASVFMNLMGESVTPRKKFIEDNAERANVDV